MKLSCSIISPRLAAPSRTDSLLSSPEPLFSLGPFQTNKESEWHEYARGGHRLWPKTQDKEWHRNLRLAFSFFFAVLFHLGFPGAQRLRIRLLMQEKWVQSLGQEDRLERKTAAHSEFPVLAWEKSYGQRSLEGSSSWDRIRVRHLFIIKQQ